MSKPVRQQFGNYRLLNLLGQGAFADVYLGSHIHLETLVAIKVLRIQLTTEEIERFRKEARIIAQLDHPHIVHILDFDVQDGAPFLIMSYIPNGTLRQRYPRGTRLPLSTVVSYVQQTASALQYAHEQHVIHCDIKPENLLFGRRQEVVLSDFGIALVVRHSLSLHMQEVAGSIAYMAPEQIEGRPCSSSDQYALAVLAYEWLSGERPFDGTFVEIASRKSTVPAPPLRSKLPELSPAVEQVIMKALAKEPQERFATIQTFADELERSCQTSAARPPGASQAAPLARPGEPWPFGPTVSASSEDLASMPGVLQAGAMMTPVLHTPPSGEGLLGGVEPESTSKPVVPVQTMLLPSRRGIARRTVVVGLLGLVAVGGAGVALNWLSHTRSTQLTSTVSPRTRTNILANLHPTDYVAFGFDPQRTHFNPVEQVLSPDTVPHLVPYWVASAGTTVNSSPAVVNGIVYVGCDDYKLYAFNARNGTPLWTFTTGGRVYSSPGINNGIVYFGSSDGKFYALDALTGKSRWIFSVGNQIYSSPMVTNGIVYFGAFDTKLYALDASNGKVLWTTPTDAYIVSSPSISNGVMYIGSGGGILYAVNATTGAINWSTRIGDRVNSSPAIANGIVYVGSTDRQLYALNASTGKILWTGLTGEPLSSSPAVAQGIVYIGSPDSILYAFNALTGKLIWSTPTLNQINGSPTVANGVVYVGSWDDNIYAFDAATGNVLWKGRSTDHVFSSPAVVNGALYVASWDSKIYAFYLPT
jgi:outer membrane protein assembly factor BamB/serine/threonine protein kinase